MQSQVNQRQLGWTSFALTTDLFLVYIEKILEITEYGPFRNFSITFSGHPSAVQISGNLDQVKNDLEQISDTRFINASLRIDFPNENNLVHTIGINFAIRHVNISIQNGSEKASNTLFSLAQDIFPESYGPSDQEMIKQQAKLSSLIVEAKKAVKEYENAEALSHKAKQSEKNISTLLDNVKKFHSDSKENLSNISNISGEIAKIQTEIANFKNQILADREASKTSKDEIGAIETKISKFFKEIEKNEEILENSHQESKKFIDSSRERTNKIIDENVILQREIKEHLLNAVGSSLFSAFEKRKKRIEISKWVWAALTFLAVLFQIGVFIWIAIHVTDLPENSQFYKNPGVLLRFSVSIPIIFFIAYSIHQYAREREYEELYGFKSTLSFSLSPYIDLIEKLQEKPDSSEHKAFVISTVQQIFDNPLSFRIEEPKGGKKDSNMIKEVLDRVIKIVEKGS